ncbi:YhgE/Pip [Heyndrickxia shackletonii]|uniref:YhgE/Pip n=1 Tax=Heyndrickxia shackletonii TaxID=157838 RepID=A0A0Q3WZ89_9BACI|nr:YhgE/Pip domain-containing protein [Heyndrickxia shackletonii]KQL55183.1 YhgE/Pip [Heyndrickxia shackletonii]NEY98702.1 YhgE/Pip domain-containing protein [Heyndrickxia shackletonii]
MGTILRIYARDMKNIITNWVALVIMLALIVLPSLYAWFNIKASWNPYGNTRGIAVAVSNLDQGTVMKGKRINVGNEVVQSLHQNKKLGWQFVSEDDALDGVKHGKYYASITIPKDFSEKITSILNANPKKPVIVYTVNEKINAVAPKITSSGASGVVDQISKNFVKTASETIFSIFREIGIELERDLPAIERVKELIFKIEADIPKINRYVNIALNDATKARDIVRNAQGSLPKVQEITKNGMELTSQLSNFLSKGEAVLNKIEPATKENLILLSEIASTSQGIVSHIQNNTASKAEIEKAIMSLQSGVNITDTLNNTLKQLDGISGRQEMMPISQQIAAVMNQFQQEINLLKVVSNDIDRGQQISKDVIDRINGLSSTASNTLNRLVTNYDSIIVPKVQHSIDIAKTSVNNAGQILNQANKDLPTIKKLLNDASKGAVMGINEVTRLKRELPGAETQIKKIANRIRDFEKKENIHDIIQLLKHDVQKESNFFKEPVLLKERQLYHIPNYGSAMSPFFTTLSLWVGAMLLISLLTVDVEDLHIKSYQIFFGRYLTFLTLGLLQSLLVTIGDIYFLHAFVLEKLWFILFGLWNSAVFITMVYTLVSVFGNIGKSIGIVLLVLQISGSGGTFPIQVTPTFFQKLNPFLPFTYSISLMREAVGGILWDIVQKDMLILCLFALLFFLIGIFLKRPINRVSDNFVKKAKESKLIH